MPVYPVGKAALLFNLNLRVREGAVYGYLGPNGAGKTTTIRVLMGFIRANSGQAFINGLNCWNQAAVIHKQDLEEIFMHYYEKR